MNISGRLSQVRTKLNLFIFCNFIIFLSILIETKNHRSPVDQVTSLTSDEQMQTETLLCNEIGLSTKNHRPPVDQAILLPLASSTQSQSTQTDLTGDDIDMMTIYQINCQSLQNEIHTLKEKLKNLTINIESFIGDDQKTCFYTGLSNIESAIRRNRKILAGIVTANKIRNFIYNVVSTKTGSVFSIFLNISSTFPIKPYQNTTINVCIYYIVNCAVWFIGLHGRN